MVYPSTSILAENPVSIVDKVADKRKTRAQAEAYLSYLYSEEGQDIAAKQYIRPRVEGSAAKHKSEFKQIDLFTVDEVIGGWQKAQKTHFSDGGTFDQIYQK